MTIRCTLMLLAWLLTLCIPASAHPSLRDVPSLGRPLAPSSVNTQCDSSRADNFTCPGSTSCCCSHINPSSKLCDAYACCSDGSQVCADPAAGSGCVPAPKFCDSDFWLYQLEQLAGPEKQGNVSAWMHWLQDLDDYRTRVHRAISYSDEHYARNPWTQMNFISPQMHPFDLAFYNPSKGYTPESWLDGVTQLYGGVDSVLLWQSCDKWITDIPTSASTTETSSIGTRAYPEVWLAYETLCPACTHEGSRQAVTSVHSHCSSRNMTQGQVLLPYNPWDIGTSRVLMHNATGDPEALLQLLEDTGADGYNGDTMVYFDDSYYSTTQAVLEPECGGSVSSLNYTFHGWGYWENRLTQPCVDRWHWLENKRITHVCDRWSKDKTVDVQSAIFNGVGNALSWENVWGTWNGLTLRGAAQIARASAVQRYFQPFTGTADFQPFYPTLEQDVFCSRWLSPAGDQLFVVINRSGKDWPKLPILRVSAPIGSVVIDCYLGVENAGWTTAEYNISLAVEALGFSCVWVGSNSSSSKPSDSFLSSMARLTAEPLSHLDNTWTAQHTVAAPHTFTPIPGQTPPGMIFVPGGTFNFTTKGVEIEGPDNYGVDFQFPWESVTQRVHSHVLRMPPLYVDEFPVTNAQWLEYIKASSYAPADDNYYLAWWSKEGFNMSGDDGHRPVTWVSPDEAAGYCAFYRKRLPHAWEWQYAASGPAHDSVYPWGNAPPSSDYTPRQNSDTDPPPPDRVDAHPKGKSIFGISDMVGNIWQVMRVRRYPYRDAVPPHRTRQFTDTYSDGHTRSQLLKGGSYYRPQGSEWYFPHCIELRTHNKYLLFGGGYNRAATVGFRCVADSVHAEAELLR